MKKYKVGIVGGTGYTGVELLRLLAGHPGVSVELITSRSEAGIKVSDMFPNLRGFYDLAFQEPDISLFKQCDLMFFATPNGVAMKQVPVLLDAGVKIIDLAADYRIKDLAVWEKWYAMTHTSPQVVEKAVYGLPELYREQIKGADIVANPGCYATAIQLALFPLIENKLIDLKHIIANAASGVSGAGRGANVATLLCETTESFKAYAAHGHRHLPEIKQQLESVASAKVGLTFVPHLIPMSRGIHASVYAIEKQSIAIEQLQQVFEQRYQDEPFVDVLPIGSHPETRTVRGANMCRIAVQKPQDEDVILVLSVVDNLVKGAAGQAIQNMNIMLGIEETLGLSAVPLAP
ncbi:MAG: N-acetyl-gamma-glutamyl-phosphate reductase [Pseudomonadota bacterium]